jgi:hypothetical protein
MRFFAIYEAKDGTLTACDMEKTTIINYIGRPPKLLCYADERPYFSKEGPIEAVLDKKSALVNYIKMKLESGDWHAVSDAANDLRVLEGK